MHRLAAATPLRAVLPATCPSCLPRCPRPALAASAAANLIPRPLLRYSTPAPAASYTMVDVLVVCTDITCLVMNVTSKYQYLARAVRVMRIARMARAARLVRRLHHLREENMRDRVATYSIGTKVRVACRHP